MSPLSPRSIAVIGASAEEKKVGHIVLQNIMSQGFTGKVFPVNPKGGEILGLPVHVNLSEITEEIDLAVIVTPAATVPGLLEDCGKKKIKTVIVISAGFSETGTDDGHALEEQLKEIAKRYGIALVGPNCLGVIRPSIGMNASFAENLDRPGNIALLSQSGALAVALLDASTASGMGFSFVVSMGNKAVMDECDFLELCLNDEETKVVGLYLESLRDGKRFREIATKVAARKPVVVIKSGTSEHGKKAVSSHTGALAGSDSAIDALCKQTGVRRAATAEEFLDLLQVLSTQPPLLSNIAVITNAGGPGILATDAAEREKLILAELTPKNAEQLKAVLPPAASIHNPIDVLGDAVADRYSAALETCARDEGIDGVVVLLTPQVMTPATEIARAIIATHESHPLMPIVTSFMGEKHVRDTIALLQEHCIPNFPTPERAMHVLAALRPSPIPSPSPSGGREIRKPFSPRRGEKGWVEGGGLLSEEATADLFRSYKIPLPSGSVAHTSSEAVAIAKRIGYPVAAKISSPQILHKTDIGCVRINLKNDEEVKKATEEILKNAKKNAPDAEIRGVLIQEMLTAGNEFIVGAIRDPQMGHLVMVGLGGIYTELFRDTAFRIAPISEDDAYAMLQELRSWKMLLGLRGQAQSDIAALASLIASVSQLVTDCPHIRELDLNPVIVRGDGVIVADAKVIVD